MTQLSLEVDRRPHTLARTTDPVTSLAAAHALSKRASHLRAVLEAYRFNGPITDVEAARRSGLDRIETTRRASELRSAGLIEPVEIDGVLQTAELPSGRRGMLCAITAAGQEALGA